MLRMSWRWLIAISFCSMPGLTFMRATVPYIDIPPWDSRAAYQPTLTARLPTLRAAYGCGVDLVAPGEQPLDRGHVVGRAQPVDEVGGAGGQEVVDLVRVGATDRDGALDRGRVATDPAAPVVEDRVL